MTAPTVTVPAPEVVVDVDLEAEVPCATCSQPATWHGVTDTCHCSASLCGCHDHDTAILASWGRARCTPCGAWVHSIAWRRL